MSNEVQTFPLKGNTYEVKAEQPSGTEYPVQDKSIEATAREASRINSLVDVNLGKDPIDRYSLGMQANPIEDFVSEIQTNRPEQILQHREVLNNAGLGTDTSDASVQQYTEDMDGTNGRLGPYRQKALEMAAGDPTVDVDELAFGMMYRMELADKVHGEEYGFGAKASDFAELFFVPGRETYPEVQLARGLGYLDGAVDVTLAATDPGQLLDNLHQVALNLKPEDRAKMLDHTLKLLEGEDNKMVKSAIVSAIFAGEYDKDLTSLFNAMDIVGVGATVKGVVKLTKGLYDTGKMVNLVKKLPTVEGQRHVMTAASNPELARAAGVTPAEVADMYNPAINGKMAVDLTGASDDVASDLLGHLELQDARVRHYNETSLREGVLTHEREKEVMLQAELEMSKKPYVSNLTVEPVDGGFVLHYDEKRINPDTGKMVGKPPLLTEKVEAPVAPRIDEANIERVEANIKTFKGKNTLQYKIKDAEDEKVGFINARDTGDAIKVVQSEIKKERQGEKLGIKAYVELADWALAKGKYLASDSVVSGDAEKLYKSLEKRGYTVTKHPETRVNDEGQLLAPKGEPVFKVEGKKETVQPKVPDAPLLTDAVKIENVRQQKRVAFQVDDQGKVEANVDEEYLGHLTRWDPNAQLAGRALREFVKDAEQITKEQSKLISTMEMALKDVYRPLNKAEAVKVDQTIIKGSKEGKEYSYKELKSMGHSEKEIRAYLGQRNVMFNLWKLENQKIVDTINAEGGSLIIVDDTQAVGRVFDNPEGARGAFLADDPDTFSITVMDDGFGTHPKGSRMDFERAGALTPEAVEDAYRRGFKLARSKNNYGKFRYNDNVTEWAWVKDRSVHSPNGKALLNRIPGYMPKARTDSFYFVKGRRMTDASNPRRMTDGKTKETEVTVAWADNLADAEAHANKLGEGYSVRFDRDLSGMERSKELTLVRGGLFSGARKSDELPFVGKSETFDYEHPMDMMQRYVNHIGKQIPSHMWRLGNEQRLLQRARQLLPGENIHNVYQILPAAEQKFTTGSKQYRYLKTMVDQIQNVAGIPTSDELAMAKQLENIGNALEGMGGLKWLSKYFYRASQSKLNIADRIRGVTFTHMLGMYNPSQFLVQASSAFAAFAVNPVAFSKSLPKMIGWQMLDGLVKDPLAQKAAADWMRSKGMAEYADSYEIWNRSGFREGVVSANSDIATLFGNKPYTASVLQRAAANNTVFYQMGELAGSRASVATAIEWYKGVKGIDKVSLGDKEALRAIYSRAEIYRLNMGKANPSALNKGWKAVPFQFQQVMSKYFEKILPPKMGGTTELTKAEKARLFAIPTALTGLAGVPGAEMVSKAVSSMMGIEQSKMDPEEARLVHGGTIGWMMSEAFDINVDFSSRMSLGTDIFKNMYDYATGGGSSLVASVLGPAGSVGTRWTNASQYFWRALDVVREDDDISSDDMIIMGKVLADALASIPSSTRNLKDYFPHIVGGNEKFTRDGRFKWEWDDMNKQTALFAAFGFQPTEQVDLYDLVARTRQGDSKRADTLKWMKTDAEVLTRLFATGMLGTDNVKQMDITNMLIHNIVMGYTDPLNQSKLISDVFDMMNAPQYDFYQLFQEYKLANITRMDDGLQFINERVARMYKQEADKMGSK